MRRSERALFAGRREHAEKIEAIRVDYVRQNDFERHKNRNREDHETLATGLKEAQWKIAKIVGGIVLLAFISGLAVRSMGAW